MFHLTVDLGQIIIGVLISTVGWLINRTLNGIFTRLDKHDEAIAQLIKDVGILTGKVE